MGNPYLFLSWSILGPFIGLMSCFGFFIFLTSNKLKKDSRLADYFTNILILIGAIAWVVLTSR
jgi:hypothetical protein